jgi:hypothetical protein
MDAAVVRNFREQCCDGGRIHRLDSRLVDGRIEFRHCRDNRGSKAEALGRTEFTTSEQSSA